MVRRIHKRCNIMEPFHRLQEEKHGKDEHSPVAPMAHKEKQQSHHGEKQQHIPCREKCGVQSRKTGKQHQPPQETPAEILSLFPLPVHLQKECKAEKQRENRIGLTGKQGKHRIKYPLVQCRQPCRLIFRINRKYEMFQIVHQHYGQHRKAPQCIHHIDTGLLSRNFFHHPAVNSFKMLQIYVIPQL